MSKGLVKKFPVGELIRNFILQLPEFLEPIALYRDFTATFPEIVPKVSHKGLFVLRGHARAFFNLTN
jgi:hypothetical protein